ncbi:snare Ykt6 [Protomyces lactucae-debilis]|uniref:Synaptobrevin homolog YKT6 n=1 Tax=Protomyces lactucae-debilis TaxID=2754530 RepID=A0A1Y2FLX9_PROLT|nr:snare Ykt6 [Protomyces lactucae-debilis]ORY84364.1 snare Ykt6 [Protomyces lactucae-debilis]
MKLYGIFVVRNEAKPAHEIVKAVDVMDFGWMARGQVETFMSFTSNTLAERTAAGVRQSVVENSYKFHLYSRTEGVCGVIIADEEYPARVAFTLLNKVLDEFLERHPRSKWAMGQPKLPMPELSTYLVKYQDPKQADTIMRVQQELDETKIILHKTIDSVLQRGEKLEDLVARSDQLSAQSKMFARQAKKNQ